MSAPVCAAQPYAVGVDELIEVEAMRDEATNVSLAATDEFQQRWCRVGIDEPSRDRDIANPQPFEAFAPGP